MADLSDVERALVGKISGFLFPGVSYLSGNYQTSAPAGGTVVVYRGWPTQSVLDADLAADRSHVAVFPEQGMTRLTTRYAPIWQQTTSTVPTLTATVSGLAVTLGGVAGAGQVVGVQYGAGATQSAYAYRLLASDTLATAAAGLAAVIPGATASGDVVTLPAGAVTPSVAVVSDQSVFAEVRRQTQGFRVICFTRSPARRDAVCAAVDNGFASMVNAAGAFTEFFSVGDNTQAIIKYRMTYTDDKPAKDTVWRRDLCYNVEYATTLAQQQPSCLFTIDNFLLGGTAAVQAGTVSGVLINNTSI